MKSEFESRKSASFQPSSSARQQTKFPPPDKKDFTKEQSTSHWQEFLAKQQQHNEHVIETNRQLAVAMTLSQPEVPTFAGDLLEYQQFIMAFKARIESKTHFSNCLFYLNQYLQGEAKELISGCLYADPIEGYIEAKRLLNEEYGDSYKISTAYMNKVLGWPAIKFDDAHGLKLFSFFLKRCNNVMKSLSNMIALDHLSNMQTVVRKLPFTLQNRWRDQVVNMRKKGQPMAKFQDLVIYIDSCAEAANDPIFSKAALEKQAYSRDEKRKKDDGKRSSFSTKAEQVDFGIQFDRAGSPESQNQCGLCKNHHDLEECNGEDHMVKGCINKRKCKTCGKLHPTALHIPNFQLPINKKTDHEDKSKTKEEHPRVINGSTGLQDSESRIFHAILPVRVKHKNSNKVIETYAFYDNGSDGCFLTESLKDELCLSGVETTLRLETMHGKSHVSSTLISDLIVTDLQDQNPVQISKSYTRDFIPVSHKQIPTPDVMIEWNHLKEISKEIPEYNPNLEIGLLIGSDCPAALEPQKVVSMVGESPFAIKLRHGWTINGPLRVKKQQDQPAAITMNRILVREVEKVKEILTPNALLDTLQMDFNDHGPPNGKAYSQEDLLFMKKVEQNTHLRNGHHEIPLPFKQESINLPNNRQQAIQRANWQKKKMLRNEKYYRDYVNFVNTLIVKGYAEKIPEEQSPPESGKIWYMPHHGLYNAKKPEKIRVVFDCSARYQETSLNDQLLQGPDLTNTLFGVLTRFRQRPYAFMPYAFMPYAFIEAMFYQVNVLMNQRDFLRFVWWPDGDFTKPMEEYRMTVHIFGVVSSPSCSNYALTRTASDNKDESGSAVAQTILNDFYVDDCLKSVDEQNEACDLIVKLRRTCSRGGFHLTKFTSNSRDILATIPEEERANEVKCLDLIHDELPIQGALGVHWCVESDQFKFRITLSTKPLTRRGILSIVSSIYDPLGFVAPFVLPAKRILQDLCRNERIGWDDEIPVEYKVKWAKWIKDLPEIESLFIKRCLKPASLGRVISRQIHTFSDASFHGYGAVAYLRLKDESDNVHCSFLLGKARVSPVKITMIPRLELVAAALSTRICNMLVNELDDKPDLIKYHTDSTTVLRYISSDQRRFHTFVANRVQAIREVSDVNQWRYVATQDNPADEASRGVDAIHLKQSCWLNGPSFLWNTEENWPDQPFVLNPVTENDPEVKKTVTTSTVIIDNTISTINKFFEFYSDWNRLKKGVAILLPLRTILLRLSQYRKEQLQQSKLKRHFPEFRQFITVQELEDAEIAIVRCIQNQAFSAEIDTLERIKKSNNQSERLRERQRKSEIKRTSSIYRVSPFLQHGVLRVGGRLRRGDLPEQMKHPFVLPNKSHVTTLLIRHVHQVLGHAGRGHVLATLREKYWIVRANTAVRHILY